MLSFLLAITVLISWDPSPPPVTGYQVMVWQELDVAPSRTVDAGNVTQFQIDLLAEEAVVVVGYHKDAAGQIVAMSYPSERIGVALASPTDPRCVPPFGADAIALFFTGYTPTTNKPGSKSNIRVQMASLTKIWRSELRLAGQAIATVAWATDLSGFWFTLPAPGSYPLSVYAVNEYGCAREVQYASPIVVTP